MAFKGEEFNPYDKKYGPYDPPVIAPDPEADPIYRAESSGKSYTLEFVQAMLSGSILSYEDPSRLGDEAKRIMIARNYTDQGIPD